MFQVKKTHRGSKLVLLGALAAAILLASSQPLAAQVDRIQFELSPNPKFTACAGAEGGGSPTATVRVVRGELADTLYIKGKNFRPHLAFDLFTIQRSNLLADAEVDPKFTNFGQAWYQTDLHTDEDGEFSAKITTILLDQIFGFDPDFLLPPTQALHVGFWFNDPNDAAACGFDVTHPTPFNGQHKAGPNAFISVPNGETNLGPLCTKPLKQGDTYVCDINE